MHTFTIQPSHLRAFLLFAAKEDVRYYLNGIRVTTASGAPEWHATDGHRLIIHRAPADTAYPVDVDVIIPRAAIEQVLKACTRKTESVAITVDGAAITLAADSARVDAIAIDGKYPDVSRVVPKQISGEAAGFNAHYLADCARASALIRNVDKNSPFMGIGYNGMGPALVILSDAAFALVMPMRMDREPAKVTVPDWYGTAASAPAAVAAAAA